MRIIKLNATESTNDYLRALTLDQKCEDYTIVVTENQTKGKGQMGSFWVSEPGKNLTFSVFKRDLKLKLEHQFLLNMIVALSVNKALLKYNLKLLKIKWPNDILAEQKKICGVLVETVITSEGINSAILGVGLNVNQLNFEGLPKASSLKQLSGVHYNLDEVLDDVLKALQFYFNYLECNHYNKIFEAYNKVLFRKEKPSTFKTAEGNLCVGIIKGITEKGLLQVLFEDDILKTFNLKEIELLY